jgi:acyl carrier protein
MAARKEIKPKVIKALEEHTGVEGIKESDRLERDLGMTKSSRESMAGKYTDISAEYGGKPISKKEAGNLTTVKESIDLVTEKTNGK